MGLPVVGAILAIGCSAGVSVTEPVTSARPIVIAHRGASGYRPEHTLASYALAIEQGADFIEPDLVPTRDGVLVARHENELSGTTDVAERNEFADRRTTKRIDGVSVTGWFSEDFSLAEIKRLKARERIPNVRPNNRQYDGQFEIPTFAEVIALARNAPRPVGVYPETKHPTFFEREGRHLDGTPIRLSLGKLIVDELVKQNFVDPNRVFIQSFEIANLRELKARIMPTAGVRFPLIQLIGGMDKSPYDLTYHVGRKDDLDALYGELLARALTGEGEANTYGALINKPALSIITRDYADGLGPAKTDVLPVVGVASRWTGEVAPFVTTARELGLAIHVYTLRAEAVFVPATARGAPQAMSEELQALLKAGVTGVFSDNPDTAVAARDEFQSNLSAVER